ncbi:MAG: DUF3467 domain-containing protein [Methanobacterium sp.]|jgi:hypothetical protein|nr:DUF3467 domain-containing protein [Methanobacterium sp.]
MKKDNPTLKKEPPFMHPSEAPRIYASGVFGGYTPHDFRLFLYSEEPMRQDEIFSSSTIEIMREVQGEIILSPLTAKELVIWLNKRVKEFEDNFGEIKLPSSVPTKD